MANNFEVNEELLNQIKNPGAALIMWGGGKDSTTVLLLAAEYCKLGLFDKLIIATFNNFLATESILKNRQVVINYLKNIKIPFRWEMDDFGGPEIIRRIYRQALLKTGRLRSICLICNMMSQILETRILNEQAEIKHLLTGNSTEETEIFSEWEHKLGFEKKSGNIRFSAQLGWAKIYKEWLAFIVADSGLSLDEINRFRLEKPQESDNFLGVEFLQFFKYHPELQNPGKKMIFINKLSYWALPQSSEGVIGTETDCALPGIMYGLDPQYYRQELAKIKKNNLVPDYLLFRGIDWKTEDHFQKLASQFLDWLGISLRDWARIKRQDKKLPESLAIYLDQCLLPIR